MFSGYRLGLRGHKVSVQGGHSALRPGEKRKDPWLISILLAGLIVYSGWTLFIVLTDRSRTYYMYVIAANAFAHSQNIYLAGYNTYSLIANKLGIIIFDTPYYDPLLTALVVWPITALPLRVGAAIWVFGSGVAFLAAAVLLSASQEELWKRRLIVLAAIGFAPALTTMYVGQVNNYVFLLTAAALTAWRDRKDTMGGCLLAVGIWLKPLAIALVGWMLLRGRWRGFVGLLAVSTAVILAGLAAFGLGASLSQFAYKAIFAEGLRSINHASCTPPCHPDNWSLLGMLSLWLAPTSSGPPLVNAPQILVPLYLVLAGAFGFATLGLLWPFGRRGRSLELEVGLLLVTTSLVFPFTWYDHLTLMFIPIVVLVERWQHWRHFSMDMLLLTVAYVFMNFEAWLFWTHFWTYFPPLLSLATASEIITWVLLARQLRKQPRILPDVSHRQTSLLGV